MTRLTQSNSGTMAKALLVLMLCFGMILPAGCASRGGRTYKDSEVRRAQQVRTGTVLDVTDVMVEEDPSLLGPSVGGVAGGVLGSLIGSGRGRTLAILGGAALGALGGAAVESGVRRYNAVQLTVSMDDNKESLSVVQGQGDVFIKGDRVRVVVGGDGSARVQHI